MNQSKSPASPAPMLRGFAAVAAAAALLGVLVLLLVPKAPATPPQPSGSHLSQTEQTVPTSPIPANPYGPEDFAWEDGFLACITAPAVTGVDVSSHQKEIDWAQVGAAGMEFAMIRIGYRGYTSGGIYEDEYARANIAGARAAGLDIGVYFYSQATSVAEAREEAEFCLAFLEGIDLELPLVYDWEYVSSDARTGDMDRQTLTECTLAFCEAVEQGGYRPMVYFNPTQGETLLELEALLEYPWWLAMYSSQMTYPHAVQMWQYTATGTVPGITGEADVNLWFSE